MFKNISLGTYYPGKSLLHRLQARTKLLVQLFIVISLVVAGQRQWHFLPFIIIVILLVLSILCSRIAPRELWRRMRLLILLTLIGAVTVLFSLSGNDDKVLYALGPLTLAYGIVREAVLIFSLVMLIFLVASYLPPLRSVATLWQRRLRPLLFLLLVITGIFLWVVRGNAAKQSLVVGPLPITHSGFWSLVSFTVVLLTLYAFSLLLTMTTSPIALIEGLTMLLSPLRRLKLPVDDFALMTLLALRFIPTLLEEVEQLTKAQTARGANFSHGTLRERIQSLNVFFVPLMHGVLRRASELATALEARGYESDGQQTRLYERALGRVDYTVLAIVLLALGGSLLV